MNKKLKDGMKMKRSMTALTLFAIVPLAMALLSHNKVFDAKYNPDKSSDLGRAKCATCHEGKTKKLNPYGEDIKKAMDGAKKLTPDMLEKVEKLDSDKDGKSNIDEIKAGNLPGAK